MLLNTPINRDSIFFLIPNPNLSLQAFNKSFIDSFKSAKKEWFRIPSHDMDSYFKLTTKLYKKSLQHNHETYLNMLYLLRLGLLFQAHNQTIIPMPRLELGFRE